jgi:malate dehydrogenase (oxaloacetate-decarboxylating)(NADP+)
MKGTEHFKRTIQMYLEQRAAEDTLFARNYRNPAKNIDDCVTYILNYVQRSGCNGFTDGEIFGQAVHYYDENEIEVGKPVSVHNAVEELQKQFPDLAVDGEMQVNFALNKDLRDDKYPFTRLKGLDVNTLVFPNMSSANCSYKLLQSLDPDCEIIGPIQMGLNKAIHFTDFESSVNDVVNITAVAVIDAYVEKLKNGK